MDFTYTVLTQHRGSGRFIVPITIEAPSTAEAASQRFARQTFSSQEDTTALLVYDDHEAHVYPVRLRGAHVSTSSLQVIP